MTPEKLQSILLIKGLSDWSIERMIEQTIANGGIVVLHLEENPEEEILQTQLIRLIKQLLDKILTRYSDLTGNINFIYTSNYDASNSLIDQLRLVIVPVNPPTLQTQLDWCRSILNDIVREQCSVLANSLVDVKLNVQPPLTKDMRKLEKWKLSVGFLISQHINKHSSASRSLERISIESNGDHHSVKVSFKSLDELGHPEKEVFDDLEIRSKDGYFFYSSNFADSSEEQLVRAQLILDMLMANFFKPAVFVVHADSQDELNSKQESLVKLISARFEKNLHQLSIEATQEEHHERIFGNAQAPVCCSSQRTLIILLTYFL
jgi:hypothetical protein